jgi:hypothetical protein
VALGFTIRSDWFRLQKARRQRAPPVS